MAGETVTVESFGVPESTVSVKHQWTASSGLTQYVWYWEYGTAIAYALTTVSLESFGIPGSTVTVTIG